MKKNFLIGILVLAVSFMGGDLVFATISGSKHDFSSYNWSTGKEICKPCHTPHNSSSIIAPLWNHTLSTTTYRAYSSPSLNATVGQPSESSKACLSCHDGTIALDAFGGGSGTPGSSMGGNARLSPDLRNDHPVSFLYNSKLATDDGTLNDPTTETVVSVDPSLSGKTIDQALLFDHKIECSSCHDVHASKGYSKDNSSKLLVLTNESSTLCLTCHNK